MKIVNNEETVMFPLAEKDGQIVATVQEFYKGETQPPQLLEKSHLSSLLYWFVHFIDFFETLCM